MSTEKKSKLLSAPAPWWEAIEAWRQAQPDIPSVSESIRRLVLAGIEATQPAKR